MGAVSIVVRVPFEVQSLGELVAYHDLHSSQWSLNEEVRSLAKQVRQELAQHYIRPVNALGDEEAYTVFCLEAPVSSSGGVPEAAEIWFQKHRRQVAALAHPGAEQRTTFSPGSGGIHQPLFKLLPKRLGRCGLGCSITDR